ncbi:hypothetical protein [Sporohalobacter salinus]|uniref:hypothetical protein n=1 Tax=Sporohalobacter salinus TaxID=1494606 RepID=UPI001961CAD0|nr:hypothetical protein [Sporohalobacter salinus]MBM7624253.1 hypothetical protein [Sporohalobacter salinus]
MIYYCFIIPIVALRGLKGREALKYSKSLVKGRWWSIFGVILVVAILSVIFSKITAVLGLFLPNNIISNMILNSSIKALSSYFIIVTVVLFLNLDYNQNNNLLESTQNNKDKQTHHITAD